MINILKPTLQRNNTKKIFGFDIETYNDNKNFLCASVFSDKVQKTFYEKEKLIDFFKDKMFKNSFVAATNLSFDFSGTFFKQPEIDKFTTQFRGSELIYAKTYLHDKNFYRTRPDNNAKTLTFIDTMNYSALSVKKMGLILKLLKLDTPKFIGKQPKDKSEWDEMIRYNMRDSEISYRYINFLFDTFSGIGATPKLTIASSSMSLFKNQYLKDTFFVHETKDLLQQFKAYYGGRTEAFKRGLMTDVNYYDFNSLYPSVMLNHFPDPNTMRRNMKNDVSYIESYEGIADVEIYCPPDIIPLLPVRNDNKLIFPTGTFRGWYSNVELRKAMDIGYVIKRIYNNYYFKDNLYVFRDFVLDLYDKRMAYKKDNNPMEYVIKILMNSLYGKFGQKFMNRDNWIPFPESIEELEQYDYIERFGNFLRVKKEWTKPRNFCFPVWALYVTAYGRIKLYDILKRSDPYYCDTDSIITKKEYKDTDALGGLKKEMRIKNGIIVKPKFYACVDSSDKQHVKIKGIGKKIYMDEFMQILNDPKVKYQKFMKFKESIRRGFIPNEIQDIVKNLTLEDDKRKWNDKFSFDTLQQSQPHDMKYISGNNKLYKVPVITTTL